VQGWRHDVALFALAAAAIMHCYHAERDVFRSKYLNVLDFVFGNTGHGGGNHGPASPSGPKAQNAKCGETIPAS